MTDIGRVFLVGCPRSGTTLVQSMLAANAAVHTLPETHFFSRIIPDAKWARRLGLTDKKVRQFLAVKLADISGGSERRPTGLQALLVSSYGKAFARFLDRQAADHEKTIWVEKTPQHLHRIAHIVKSIPDAKFVHILRAGEDTIASLYHVAQEYPDRWGGAQSIDDCATRWIRDLKVSKNFIGLPRHHFLVYDDLIKEPERALQELCEFAGIAYQDRMLRESSSAYHDSVAEDDAEWTGNAGRPLYQHKDGKFQTYLNDDQRSRITAAIAAAELANLGATFGVFDQ